MNVENEKTELGLAPSYSDNCIKTRRSDNEDSGAGANAGSSAVNMKFAATDPLSELVWSPQNGLSLRCADFSFTNKKKPSLNFEGVEPSNTVNEAIDENNKIMFEAEFQMNVQVTARDSLGRNDAGVNQDCMPSNQHDKSSSGHCGYVEEMNAGACSSIEKNNEKDHSVSYKMNGTDGQNVVQKAEVAETAEEKFQDSLDNPKPVRAQIRPSTENQTSRMEIATNPDLQRKIEVTAYEEPEKKDEDKMKEADPVDATPVERLESMAENDLPTPACENAYGSTSKIPAAECSHEGKNSYQHEETQRYIGKGKEKVFSDGDIDGRTSKKNEGYNDESYGSVESCNSTRISSRGKKRSNFKQQLITSSSKHVKLQIHESPGSRSKIKQDSSFMNWISNMTKGFWKSNNEDGAPSHALTLAHANNHSDEVPDQNFISCCRKQDTVCRNVGFQSIFHSIYCSKRRSQEAEANIDATPGKNLNLQKQALVANEKHEESLFGNKTGLAAEARVSSEKLISNQANKTSSSEKRDSCNLENCKEKVGKGSFSSLGKCKLNEDQKIVFTNRNDRRGSLWIARFSSKASGLVNKDHHNVSYVEPPEYSNNCVKPVASIDIKTDEPAAVVGKELQKYASESYASVGISRIHGFDDPKLIHNLNPIVPSSRIKSSEAMSSLFARRLDAIKHIMPSDNVVGPMILMCFYCGKKGHHLRDCSEVTDTDLEDILGNINAHNGTEEPSGLCIKCFQLNHWAATCPHAIQRNSRTEDNKIMMLDKDNPTQYAGSKSNRTFRLTKCAEDLAKRYEASGSSVKDLKKTCVIPGSNLVGEQNLDTTKGIFDAVRVLRLSRTDVLKWMNSNMSLSHLEGFFLRLRLGKWKEGLGGTGYYLACITGSTQEQSSPKNSNNSISVTVGGINCLVESQYISNHDFLEEELKGWWWAAVRNGGDGVPSDEDLQRKVREKKMLGF